jgi:hypothetical protein
MKIPSGGWFSLVIGLALFAIMSTWRAGRQLVLALATCEEVRAARVSGTAVYLTIQTAHVPATLLRNLNITRCCIGRFCCRYGSSPSKYRGSRASTGSERVNLAAAFGRLRPISALRKHRAYSESWVGEVRGLELDPSQFSFLSDAPTSSQARGSAWRDGASRSTPALIVLRHGRLLSFASPRIASSNSAPWPPTTFRSIIFAPSALLVTMTAPAQSHHHQDAKPLRIIDETIDHTGSWGV